MSESSVAIRDRISEVTGLLIREIERIIIEIVEEDEG